MIDSHDVVIRYLRLRDASNLLTVSGAGGARRIIVDHVSTSWATDGNFRIWRNEVSSADIREITFQRSLSAEVHKDFLIGGNFLTQAHVGVYDVSIHHNLFAHADQRNPRVSSGNAQSRTDRGTELVNNVQYNWAREAMASRQNSVHDIVNNYSKPGPMTWSTSRIYTHAFYDSDRAKPLPDPSIYIEGNVMGGASATDWDLLRDWYSRGETLPTRFRRSSRLPQPTLPVPLQTGWCPADS